VETEVPSGQGGERGIESAQKREGGDGGGVLVGVQGFAEE
jgi:hypothetical protein